MLEARAITVVRRGRKLLDDVYVKVPPGRVTAIVEPDIPREAGPDKIRRDPVYLDTVEEIWHGLKHYLD